MVADKEVILSNGKTVFVKEITVAVGLILMAELDKVGCGIDEFIFVRTAQLLPLIKPSLSLGNRAITELVYSDLDNLALAFVEVNKSFLSRVVKMTRPKLPPESDGPETLVMPSTQPASD